MPSFGQRSATNLSQCAQPLQDLFNEVIRHYDCSVICGHRGEEDQEEAFRTGKTKVHWPNSKHNSTPSQAADVVPYPIDWQDTKRFYHFVGYVKATADQMGISIRCGADWDGDNDLSDQTFYDLPHFELV